MSTCPYADHRECTLTCCYSIPPPQCTCSISTTSESCSCPTGRSLGASGGSGWPCSSQPSTHCCRQLLHMLTTMSLQHCAPAGNNHTAQVFKHNFKQGRLSAVLYPADQLCVGSRTREVLKEAAYTLHGLVEEHISGAWLKEAVPYATMLYACLPSHTCDVPCGLQDLGYVVVTQTGMCILGPILQRTVVHILCVQPRQHALTDRSDKPWHAVAPSA